MLANGEKAKIGSHHRAGWDHFQLNGNDCPESETGVVSMETLLKGMCNVKHNFFIDILENFIVFDDSTGGRW